MSDGKIIKSGDADLALYVEKNGYSEILNEKKLEMTNSFQI
jgi:Fe-S cluster assembly ATPase SufC